MFTAAFKKNSMIKIERGAQLEKAGKTPLVYTKYIHTHLGAHAYLRSTRLTHIDSHNANSLTVHKHTMQKHTLYKHKLYKHKIYKHTLYTSPSSSGKSTHILKVVWCVNMMLMLYFYSLPFI